MNSSLEQDYDGYQFSSENQLEAHDIGENFQKFNDRLSNSSSKCKRCEICDQKFETKKDLQTHLLIHLGKPRVVLKRISNSKPNRKSSSDNYWSEPEPKGTLKITLKLKKSPISENFTVVSSSEKESCNSYNELEKTNNYESKSDSEEEKTAEQSFENVIIHQENTYDPNDEDNFEPEHNPLDSFEKPLMDNNEGDSGVGSDTANLMERDDQNMDDLPGDNISNSDQTEEVENEDPVTEDPEIEELENEEAENEDPENESLEATCRETIENLKKLGELESRYVNSRSSDILKPREVTIDQDEDEEDIVEEEEESSNTKTTEGKISNPIEELQSNSEISIVPKSVLKQSTAVRSEAETEIVPLGNSKGTSSFNWSKVVSDDSNQSDKSREESRRSRDKEESENAENAGSILQNFLLEQQRSRAESSSLQQQPALETEYVSLEKLAETVNTCRVCNEKFKDIAHLDAHKSKVGHYQCSVPDCSSLVFTTPSEVTLHKAQAHGAPISPNLGPAGVSPHHLAQTHSPHSQSPRLSQTHSPLQQHLNASPASPTVQTLQQQHSSRNSPITSPHTNSPTFPPSASQSQSQQHVYPPVNLDQAPVQQLAQQVQRMPLPQAGQLPAGGIPGAGAPPMLGPATGYYPQPPGRPPMYRMQTPSMPYPPHLAQMYAAQQYAAAAAAGNPYQQLSLQSQMQSQMPPQAMPRGRYPAMVPGQSRPDVRRQQRLSQPAPVPQPSMPPMQRQRMKRPMPASQPVGQPQPQPTQKQRRMDVLLPDRNEDADCHVIAQQKRNDGLPVIQNVQGGATVQQQQQNARADSTIHLTDSITLSVRQPAQINANLQASKKSDTATVANVLAARGITVTPASVKKSMDASSSQAQQSQPTQQQSQQQQQQQPAKPSINVSTLNLNSAISIIPAASQRKQQQQQQQQQQEQTGQFAVPQNKQNKQANSEVERPPRPPTVDLTQDTAPLQPVIRRGRPPRMLQSLTCQVCDKRFQSQEMLNQHMATHRTTNKLLHKCNLCPAQYPTASALATHKKTYHKEVDTTVHQNGNIELAIPVVDLKSSNTLARLGNLGIQSYIPLTQLSALTGGNYGLPIVTIDSARNPNTNNLAALGATSILSLGTLKHLTHR